MRNEKYYIVRGDRSGVFAGNIKERNGKEVLMNNARRLWHTILTGSCLMGRKQFVESNNLDLSRQYSVKEFISICENSYRGDIIKKLKQYYK